MAEVITGKVKAKAAKGVLLEGRENWFSVNPTYLTEDSVSLAEIEKGMDIEVTYTKKGVFYNVSKILVVVTAKVTSKTEVRESGTSFVCTDCGKALKDGKYKKCFMCNKKAPTQTQVVEESETGKEKETWKPKSNYGSPEDVVGKEVGCAANCAAQIMSGTGQLGDTESILETWRVLFNGILEHIRVNK